MRDFCEHLYNEPKVPFYDYKGNEGGFDPKPPS